MMSLSRFATLLACLVALAVVVSCATTRARTKYAPIVYVSVEGAKAVPDIDPIPVHARSGKGHDGQPLPSVVNWFTSSGVLKIELKDPAQQCFRKEGPNNDGVTCVGGHCWATTNVDFHGAEPAHCAYRVWIEGVTQPYDPEVIVDNCCSN